jgi:hypothetical protein
MRSLVAIPDIPKLFQDCGVASCINECRGLKFIAGEIITVTIEHSILRLPKYILSIFQHREHFVTIITVGTVISSSIEIPFYIHEQSVPVFLCLIAAIIPLTCR